MSFVRFIPRPIRVFIAIIKKNIINYIFCLFVAVDVNINDFCILVFYSESLSNLLISSNKILSDPLGF